MARKPARKCPGCDRRRVLHYHPFADEEVCTSCGHLLSFYQASIAIPVFLTLARRLAEHNPFAELIRAAMEGEPVTDVSRNNGEARGDNPGG